MAQQRGSRKLTRADVLVAVITCLLFILLVPALFAKPREGSVRRLCAANLAQIGKAMLVYAGDNEGDLPRAGGPGTMWGTLPFAGWRATDRRMVFGLTTDGTGGTASISSSFYLLVKYNQLSPRVFVCKGDKGTTEFKMSGRTDVPPSYGLADVWDFGPPDEALRHCSYAYHIPYGIYALNTSLDPNLAVAADRNPWIISPAADPAIWVNFRPDIAIFPGWTPGASDQARQGNSVTHRLDGQNVLFLDGRVTFERRAYCGVDKDNIYTVSTDTTGRGAPYGVMPMASSMCTPMNRKDSLLVHDPDSFGYTATKNYTGTKKR